MQGIEPAARLVDGLADVIGRELGFELLLILERIVPLRHRHRARVKPDVDQVRHARHLAAAVWAVPMDLIHIRAVQIELAQIAARLFG